MSYSSHRETLKLNIQGISLNFVIPHYSTEARRFCQMHLENPAYEYEAVMVALLTRMLQASPSPVFIDLGSFIGYYTAYVAKLLGPEHKIYSIESNPQHIEVLQDMLALNQIKNVELIHTALSDQAETLRIEGNAVYAHGPMDGVLMPAQTLDDLCQDRNIQPTIAKMDVHGFEGKMLGGMRRVLKENIDYLLLELHPNVYLEKYTPGITRMQILDQLEADGFSLYYIAGHRYSWSDGMRRFFETGQFAYQALTRETRGLLLFDRHNYVLVAACKQPLEDLIGPSIIDPSVE